MGINYKRKIIAEAPARICLFGDHQDYLGLPIIACAIDKSIKVIGIENDKMIFNISLPDLNDSISLKINHPKEIIESEDFLSSSLKVLKRYGCIPDKGYDITIYGNIPINAGLSSSSAFVVAWIRFLIEAFGIDLEITSETIAKLAYESEVLEMNSSGGKMDQFTISIGNIIYLETDDDSYFKNLPVHNLSLIIGESGIPKATLEVLKDLKEKTWKAINYLEDINEDFQIKNVQVSEISSLINNIPENLQIYFAAAIKNHDITQKAFTELKSDNFQIKTLGELMNEHHNILRDYLDLTVPKIDDMVESALNSGAYGAKIVGSGKGGSIVALCDPGKEGKVISGFMKSGAKNAYKASIAKGARILKD